MNRYRRTALACTVVLALHGTPPLLGADKVKHFLMSFLVQSTGFSVGRAAGLSRANSQAVGAAGVATVGLVKELQDRRRRKPFSIADLAWDAAGGAAAASLMNGTR